MTNDAVESALERLGATLRSCAPAAVAVSGGVDSMTLAYLARRILDGEVRMFHAVSAAVPPLASARVRRYAEAEGWQLTVLDAGEFSDEKYLENPANRCFFCKTNLYRTLNEHTDAQLLSGTNLDDLGDWRPGLRAAANHAVRHPFVEAAIDKETVRALARRAGLGDISELPAAPCLSSRVETGLRISARELRFIDAAETMVRGSLAPQTVRCRLRANGIVVELDAGTHARTDAQARATLTGELHRLAQARGVNGTIAFAVYQRGSAFLR